jgi:PhoPQ-activated pathogenicity-related protein
MPLASVLVPSLRRYSVFQPGSRRRSARAARSLTRLASSRRSSQFRAQHLSLPEPLEERIALTVTPLAAEYQINTTVANDQRAVAIGSHPLSTQTVMAWVSVSEDGSGDGVVVQRYDQFGTRVGNPFRANTVTSGNQTAPAVALDSLGNFVVTWQTANQDGSGDGIYARRYAFDGTPLAAEFRVNTTTAGNQQAPAIAMDDDGDFAIAYHSANRDGNGNGVAVRVYRATGTAVGNEILVNQFSTGDQQLPSIAMSAAGVFVVTWQSAGQDGSGTGIYARRFNRDGVAQANEFLVTQVTAGNQVAPSIAMQSDGSFVIAWQGPGIDGDSDGIVARRFSNTGVALANEFQVNQFSTGAQAAPSVSATGAGGFVIAWQSPGQDGNSDAIVVRRYDSAGTADGSELIANTFVAGSQAAPAVASEADGDFLVAWQSPVQETGGGASLGAFARRFSAVNDAPVLKQVSNQAIDLGGTVSFSAVARDQETPLDTITYSLAAGAPAGASIDSSTGVFTWDTASSVDAGRFFVTVEATDSLGLVDRKVVPITLFEPGERTPLDDFVNALDPAYTWSLRSRVDGDGFTKYNLLVTSGTWRTLAEVNKPLWQHWVVLYVPDVILSNKALMLIDGGSNTINPPTSSEIDAYAGPAAIATGTVLIDLFSVPSQPLQFAGESFSRSEDSIIAYSWRKFLETGDTTWPVNLPMTRAAVRTMDAVMDFLGAPVGGNLDIESFIVGGGSKRGWTTWLAAAVDPRISYAVPVVADLLNMQESFVHHYAFYNGTFSAAVNDYVSEGILNVNNFGTEGIDQLLSIVDPLTYRDRLTLPKYMLNASGDEFFVPDSWQFYYDQLEGPKWIRYVPNSGHGISDVNVYLDIFNLYGTIVFGGSIPEYNFTQLEDGTIEVTTAGTVVDAKLWQATNATKRDFRYPVIGNAFTSTQLTDQGGGTFRGNVDTPSQGWRAYFVQLTFANPIGLPLTVTTGVYIKGPPTNQQPLIDPIPEFVISEGAWNYQVVATNPEVAQSLAFSLAPGAPAGLSIHPTSGLLTGNWSDQVPGTYEVTVVVWDNGTPALPDRETFRYIVVNAAPTASLAGPSNGVRGQSLSFTLLASDPSSADQAAGFTFQIDWNGDGSIDQTVMGPSGTVVEHTFGTNGDYNLRVTATDKDLGQSSVVSHAVAITTTNLVFNALTGLTDLYWGGTAGVDAVFLLPSGPTSVNIYAPVLNSSFGASAQLVTGVTGKIVAYGQGGDDVLVAELLNRPVEFYGGDGHDVLVGGPAADRLDGGAGNDILIGGTAVSDLGDTLFGGAGDDLLIGHAGADQLHGGSGSDLLLAGGLVVPDLPTAVFAIQAEWLSGRALADRAANLLGSGSGPRANGDHYLIPGVTAWTDSPSGGPPVIDQVYGDEDDDWLLYDFNDDQAPDADLEDLVTNLSP